MTRDQVLKAFEQLSAEDQEAVRAAIAKGGATSCCGGEEMKQRMESMMKMMHSSENPMEHCNQMMEMCQEMMGQNMQAS